MLQFALLFSLLSPPTPNFPGQCDELTFVPAKGGPRLQRVRRPTSKTTVLAVIKATADEMGADPNILLAIAQHESHWQPAALHILPKDQKAGQDAWQSATFSQKRSDQYRSIVAKGPSHPRFYPAKLGLWRMEQYQTNAFWNTKTTVGDQEMSVWAWGYGLYGMAPVLYVRLWDTSSPPWVLCDPVVATATLIWALRGQKAACAAQGETGTVEQVVARFATGRCGRKIKKSWRGVLAKTKKVSLGKKWKQETTDRSALLLAIQKRLEIQEG